MDTFEESPRATCRCGPIWDKGPNFSQADFELGLIKSPLGRGVGLDFERLHLRKK